LTASAAARKLSLVALPGFSPVSANAYFEVFEDAEAQVVLAQRTQGGTVGSDELRMIVWALESLFDPRTRGWGLVVDTRLAVGNNDPRFEQALIKWSRDADEHFARFAVLVRTQVGALQAARHTAHSSKALATADEAEAHAWARA